MVWHPAALLEMARRLGPRPYSELGPNPAPELPSTPGLVGWLVDAIDTWWAELGWPDPFTLVEVGAGDGTRAEAYLAAGPACGPVGGGGSFKGVKGRSQETGVRRPGAVRRLVSYRSPSGSVSYPLSNAASLF